jgi:hypothetical protein
MLAFLSKKKSERFWPARKNKRSHVFDPTPAMVDKFRLSGDQAGDRQFVAGFADQDSYPLAKITHPESTVVFNSSEGSQFCNVV